VSEGLSVVQQAIPAAAGTGMPMPSRNRPWVPDTRARRIAQTVDMSVPSAAKTAVSCDDLPAGCGLCNPVNCLRLPAHIVTDL
jgi:hypothetical protein